MPMEWLLLDTTTQAFFSHRGILLLDKQLYQEGGMLPDTEERNVNLAQRRLTSRYDEGMAASR